MRVLVIGSGAREHALSYRLSLDSQVSEVLCAPGNAGTAQVARNVDVSATDLAGLVSLAKAEEVGLVVVGPEAPLVDGVVDAMQAAGILAFGPSKAAAQLEGSKIFSKEFMARHGVPTADFKVFDDAESAKAFIREANRPLVVKADGLAAGKGVVVAKDADEACAAVDMIMADRAFGAAGDRVLIEECLRGQEVSFHVVSDGKDYIALAPAQDHKRAYDNDQGPNTGGMGAYSPPPVVTAEIEQQIIARVVEPTLKGMAEEGNPFRGTLFIGLMIHDGVPMVLEYNTRFGDPECECIMARWQGDVMPMLLGSAKGDFEGFRPSFEAPCAMAVVVASGGYPGSYEKGRAITGLDVAAKKPGVIVFHAGTAEKDGAVVNTGGRVLAVTAIGETIDEAAEKAYAAVDVIHFDGCFSRRDIGHHARTK